MDFYYYWLYKHLDRLYYK